MNASDPNQQQQYSLQQSMLHSNGAGGVPGMGILLPQQQTQMTSPTFANEQFNTAQGQNNFMNIQSFGEMQPQQVTSFMQEVVGNIQQQNHHNGLQQMNSFAVTQSLGSSSNIPNQFSPHLLQNQTQLLSVHNQFRDTMNDWRSVLSFQDRSHVVRQFGVAVRNALPPPHQNAAKVENLAKGLEQHIYESAESRANYMEKIKDQLSNIERKATEVRNSQDDSTPHTAIQAASQFSDGVGSIPSEFASNVGLQNKSNLNENPLNTPATNDLGLEVRSANLNPNTSESSVVDCVASPNYNGGGVSLAHGQDAVNEGSNVASQQADASNSGNVLDFSKGADRNTSSKGNENLDQTSNFGESQGNGMKVTLFDLQESEKDSVRAKMDQIRPNYLRIDALISTLLNHGGDREFDKVRKLTGMKQMLQAQFEGLHQNVFFIRPETLQQLLPSLNQYFEYAELIGNRSSGNTPILHGNQSNVSMGMNGQLQQQRANSPMMHPNVLNAQNGQKNSRQGSISPLINAAVMNHSSNIRQPMSNQMQVRPMLQQFPQPHQIQHQTQIIQNKLMHIQHQLQQVHQISMGPIGPEQMQGIHMKQQELLRHQQGLTEQLNQYNQMQLAQQRNLNAQRQVRPGSMMEMNHQIQHNQMMNGAIRHLNPQMYIHRQAQQMAQAQMNAFQGQQQQNQFQNMGQNNMQINNGSLVQISSAYADDSPKPASSSQVGTPLVVNSPADTTTSAQADKTSPKQNIVLEHATTSSGPPAVDNNAKGYIPQVQSVMQNLTSTNNVQHYPANSMLNQPQIQGMLPYNVQMTAMQMQFHTMQQQPPTNASNQLSSIHNMNAARSSAQPSIKTQRPESLKQGSDWGDDAFSFGNFEPVSAGVENDEENVEDFFNWDYEPPTKSANHDKADDLEFLADEPYHESSPASLDREALCDETASYPPAAQTLKRGREEHDECSLEKRAKPLPADLEQELLHLAS